MRGFPPSLRPSPATQVRHQQRHVTRSQAPRVLEFGWPCGQPVGGTQLFCILSSNSRTVSVSAFRMSSTSYPHSRLFFRLSLCSLHNSSPFHLPQCPRPRGGEKLCPHSCHSHIRPRVLPPTVPRMCCLPSSRTTPHVSNTISSHSTHKTN